MGFPFLLIFLFTMFASSAQVDNTLDSYEEYLTIVKSDTELYELHKSAISYEDKAQGYGIASGILLGLAAFGAITVNPNGAADPQPGSLGLLTVGGLLGSLTGLVAIGSYSKSKSRKKKIKRILKERYNAIDNYTFSIRSTNSSIGLVVLF